MKQGGTGDAPINQRVMAERNRRPLLKVKTEAVVQTYQITISSLIKKITDEGWDWKAHGGSSILAYLKGLNERIKDGE